MVVIALNTRPLEGKKGLFCLRNNLKEEKRKEKEPTAPAVPRRSPIQVLGRPDAA